MKLQHIIIGISVFLFGCNPKINQIEQETKAILGKADFSRYFAFGNSLTAGFADGALYLEAQKNSYPQILSEQMRTAGLNIGAFTQPLMPAGNGLSSDGKGRLVFKRINGAPIITFTEKGETAAYTNANYPYNNSGVPGISIAMIDQQGYITANPYSKRMNAGANKTYLDFAKDANATFFTMWLGSNDVLAYAADGGKASGNTITEVETFTENYKKMLNAIIQNRKEVKGVVLNIPDIFCASYFTTVPYNALVLTKEQADSFNNLLKKLGLQANDAQALNFQEGPNNLIIVNEEGKYIRQISNEEIPLLPALSKLMDFRQAISKLDLTTNIDNNTILAIMKKLPTEKDVLTKEDIEKIKKGTKAFNESIQTILQESPFKEQVHYVDISQHLCAAASSTPLTMNNIPISIKFIEGGLLSLDGLHTTQRGSAYVANILAREINKAFGTHIPQVDISHYPGVEEQK